jgi:integral membrane protein
VSALLVWRFIKFVALALFGAGLLVACASHRQRDRLTAAHLVATSGLLLAWLSGFGLLRIAGHELSTPWVLEAMAASLLALGGAVLAASIPRARALGGGLAAAGFAAATGCMVGRGTGELVLVGVLPALFAGAGAFAAARAGDIEPDPDLALRTRTWFFWIARAEGSSLIVLVGIYLPLKRLAGIAIDGGQGWIGWIHGMLVLVYLVALVAVTVVDRWGAGRSAFAFFASLFPGGTFLFERLLTRAHERA